MKTNASKLVAAFSICLFVMNCNARAQENDVWGKLHRLIDKLSGSDARADPNHLRIWKGKPADYFEDRNLLRIAEVVVQDNTKELSRLLTEDADLSKVEINKTGKAGMTLLYFAYLEGRLEAFTAILAHGGNPDVPLTSEIALIPGVGLDGRTRFRSVLLDSLQNDYFRPGFFAAAIPYTKSPNQTDRQGNSLMHVFVQYSFSPKDFPQLESILAMKPNVNLKNSKGETCLHLAAKGEKPQLMLKLLHSGADPSIPFPDGSSLTALVLERSQDPENSLNEYYDRVVAWLREHEFSP